MKGFILEPARARFAFVCFSLAALLALGLHGSGFAQAHASAESPEADAAAVYRNDDYLPAVWLARSSGVVKLAPDNWSLLLDFPLSRHVQRVAIDEQTGRVWFYGSRLLQAFGAGGEHLLDISVPQRVDHPLDVELAVDSAAGAVWLAQYRTLHRFNQSGVREFARDLPEPVKDLSVDPQSGHLYYLTDSAVYVLDEAGELIQEIQVAEGTAEAVAWDGANQYLWVATSEQVKVYSPEGLLVLSERLPGVLFAAADGRGSVWLASATRLHRMHGSGVVELSVSPLQAMPPDRITQLVVDRSDGSLWVGGVRGLSHVDENGLVEAEILLQDLHGRGPAKDVAHYVDTVAPEIAIRSPADGAYLANLSPDLSIDAEDAAIGVDPASLEVRANHVPAPMACQVESPGVPMRLVCMPESPLTEGPVYLEVSLADYQGNRSATANVLFHVDITPPSIVIESPMEGAWVNQSEQRVVGYLDEAGDVTLNGTPLTLDVQHAFSHVLTLEEGPNSFTVVARDLAGNQTVLTRTVNLDTVPPAALEPAAVGFEFSQPDTVTLTGGPGAAEAGTVMVAVNTRTGESVTQTVAEDGSFTLQIAAQAGDTITLKVVDRAGNSSHLTEIVLPVASGLPPDPATVAPPLDLTVATTVHAATAFLYTGSNPIQRDVEPETIEAERVAVMRGLVSSRDGEPLPGVRISVKDHPELGYTLSRADGMFDLAVNGGGYLTLNYELEGYLPIQRQMRTPWQDYVWLPDVVMIPLDEQVTTVDLASAVPVQVARGSVIEDSDGVRRATLMFSQGTQAEMVMPGGTTQALTTLNVRATEYTVGENGPEAMPALLPPTSGYTYAVELSVDEALAAGATEVRFDRPVPFYVENFLDFPVGGAVPTGWYDRERAAWIPSDNGRVIEILAINNGFAELDLDGSGTAADASGLAALGISDHERRQLAALYEPGQSLWRVPITHFTPWDHNWPYGPPEDAEPPPPPPPEPDDEEKPDCEDGSIIECQNGVVREIIPIMGTPYSLSYSTQRVRRAENKYRVAIPLSNESVPSSLKHIVLELSVAGQQRLMTFPPSPNQTYEFVWDGKDGYGREVQSQQLLHVKIGYVYSAVYMEPKDFLQSFGLVGDSPISADEGRSEITVWAEAYFKLGTMLSKPLGLGGWQINQHHAYQAGTLYYGDGRQRHADHIGEIITTVAGGGSLHWSENEGQLATKATLESVYGVASRPDGSFYIAAERNIWLVDAEGIIRSAVGSPSGRGEYGDDTGEGTPAIEIKVTPRSLALAPTGELYFYSNGVIYRLDKDGMVRAVIGRIGTSTTAVPIQGVPAIGQALSGLAALAVSPSGDLYLTGSKYIGRISAEGLFYLVAGGDGLSDRGEGVRATTTRVNGARGLAIDDAGNLYFVEQGRNRVRKIDRDGYVVTVAGTGVRGFAGDGGLAKNALLDRPTGIALDKSGNLFVEDYYNHRVRKIDTQGLINTVAGSNRETSGGLENGDGELAAQGRFNFTGGLAFAPDGALYVGDQFGRRVRKISPRFGEMIDELRVVSSDDGLEIYGFNSVGRHLWTRNTLTAALSYSFEYDINGHLYNVADAYGNVTTVRRTLDGSAVTITAPDGQKTSLKLDNNGYLAHVANPAGEIWKITYAGDGLLMEFRNPRGNLSVYQYDAAGRLRQSRNAKGGGWIFSRTEFGDGYETGMTSTEGRTTQYRVEHLPGGVTLRTNLYPDKTVTTNRRSSGETTTKAANGVVTRLRQGSDPRFGMTAPVPLEAVATTPGGLASTSTSTRSVSLAVPDDPLSHTELTETTITNGRTRTAHYDTANRTWTTTSAAGRIASLTISEQGSPVRSVFADLAPTELVYDTRGRVTRIERGASDNLRATHYLYNTEGYLASITDALERMVAFDYDAAGRVTSQVLPDGRKVGYQYDANGNLIALTPPGRESHVFDYDAVDQEAAYTPPELPDGATVTRYQYNLDKQLTAIERPDEKTVTLDYNSGGKLSAMTIARGQYGYSYHATTGQLSQIAAPDGGSLDYTWDGFLPLMESWSGTVGGSVSQSWNNNFWLTQRCVNTSDCIDFTYDNDGLLTQAGALALQRNVANGLIDGATLVNTTSGYSYNSFGELTGSTSTAGASLLAKMTYQRDALGRITVIAENVPSPLGGEGQGEGEIISSYEYDLAGRLTRVTRNGQTTIWHYDANGNRTHENGVPIASYDAQDRLLTYKNASYSYTKNGELLSKTESGATTSYSYDELGNLLSAQVPDDITIDYVIDGRNRRIGKQVNGHLVQGFLYKDQLNPVAELDGAGNLVSRFVYAEKAHVPSYMIKGGITYRIISDHLGSVRLVVNADTGEVAQRISYDVWGKVLEDTNPGFQPFGFAGGLYDQHTQLVRFGARDYDPETGRWTAKDPIRFAGGDTNLYGYVLGDPVNWLDPAGLCPKSGWESIYEFLNNHGVVSITLNAGAGVGITGQVSVTGTGVQGYAGVGLGVGAGVSLTGGVAAGTTSGWTAEGSVSGGVGPGASATISTSEGGNGASAGIGLGLGLGASATVGYGGTIVSFDGEPSASDCDC